MFNLSRNLRVAVEINDDSRCVWRRSTVSYRWSQFTWACWSCIIYTNSDTHLRVGQKRTAFSIACIFKTPRLIFMIFWQITGTFFPNTSINCIFINYAKWSGDIWRTTEREPLSFPYDNQQRFTSLYFMIGLTYMWSNKKLSYRREDARPSMTLKILLIHSRSLKIIRNYTTFKFLLVFRCNYVAILYCFWDIQHRIMACCWSSLG